jgi:hypothetical protein
MNKWWNDEGEQALLDLNVQPLNTECMTWSSVQK